MKKLISKLKIVDIINIVVILFACLYMGLPRVLTKDLPRFNFNKISDKVSFKAEDFSTVPEDYWVYKDETYCIYKGKLYKGNLKKIDKYVCDIKQKDASILYVDDNKIFYYGYTDNDKTYYYDMDKQENRVFSDTLSHSFAGKINDNLCFQDEYGKVAVYDLKSGQEQTYDNLSSSGKIYITKEGEIWMYGTLGVLNEKTKRLFEIEKGEIKGITVYDGRLYVITYGEIRVIDIETEKVLRKLPLSGYTFQYFNFNENIYATKDGSIYVFNPEKEKFEIIAHDDEEDYHYVESVQQVDDVFVVNNMDSSGRGIISIYENKKKVWQIETSHLHDFFVDDEEKCLYYYDFDEKVYKKYNF